MKFIKDSKKLLELKSAQAENSALVTQDQLRQLEARQLKAASVMAKTKKPIRVINAYN